MAHAESVRGLVIAEDMAHVEGFPVFSPDDPVDIRNRFQASILLIKRKGVDGELIVDDLPGADFVFQEGDVMLVLGQENRISRFEKSG